MTEKRNNSIKNIYKFAIMLLQGLKIPTCCDYCNTSIYPYNMS